MKSLKNLMRGKIIILKGSKWKILINFNEGYNKTVIILKFMKDFFSI